MPWSSACDTMPSIRKLCYINSLNILETILKLQMRSHDSSVFDIQYSLAAILDFHQTAWPIKIAKRKSVHSCLKNIPFITNWPLEASFNLEAWFVAHISFFLYIFSVSFLTYTLLISVPIHSSETTLCLAFGADLNHNKKEWCERQRLFISLFLPVRSQLSLLLPPPPQLLPCAPRSSLRVYEYWC